MDSRSDTKKSRLIYLLITSVVIFVVLVAGRQLWRQVHNNLQDELLYRSESFSKTINLMELNKLSGTIADIDLPEYQRLKHQLILSRQLIPNNCSIYLMGKNMNGSVFFYVDSETPGSKNESHPGQTYDDDYGTVKNVFSKGLSEISKPVIDDRGTCVSALVPLYDPNSGEVLALFGVDIDAKQWNQNILNILLLPYGFLVLLFLFVQVSILFFSFRKNLPPRVQKSWINTHAEFFSLFIFGLLVTSILTWQEIDTKENNRKTTFENLAASQAGYVLSYFQDIEKFHLAGLANFFESSQYVDRDEFSRYTAALAIDPKTMALEWIPEVPASELKMFEEQASIETGSDFKVWELSEDRQRIPVLEREFYYPVYYVNPRIENEYALGFDMGSETNRKAMLDTAFNTGLITASDPIILVNDLRPQIGILVTRSIIDREKASNQNGFILVVLRMENLLESVLSVYGNQDPFLYIDLLQLNSDLFPTYLAGNSPEEISLAHIRNEHHDHLYSDLTFYQPIFAFGKAYELIIHPSGSFMSTYPIRAGWITAVIGTLFSLLIAGVFYLFLSRGRHLESMVADRTSDLALSEQKYRNLAESTSAVLWEYDIKNDRWSYVAPQIMNMTGWHPDDFTNLQFWTEHLYHDDQKWAPAFRADFLDRGDDFEFEYRFLKPDGSYLWIRDVVSVEIKEGIPIFLRGYMLDITKKKESENQLRMQSLALFTSANAIIITDKQGVIEWSNPAFSELTGYTLEESIGKKPRELLFSDIQKPEFYEIMWKTILSGNPWRGEIVNRKKNGNLYSEEMTITPLKDENGLITHFIAIKQDISERKQHELEMQAIATISSVLRTAETRAEMNPIVLEKLGEIFKADGASLVIRDKVTNETVLEAAIGVYESTLVERLPPGISVSGKVIQSGDVFITDDISQEKDIVWSDAFDITSAIVCVPLMIDGTPIGTLTIGRVYPFQTMEVRLLTSIADIVANAIHRESLRVEMIDQLERLSTLRSIDQVLTSIVDLRVILNYILEQITLRLKIDAAAIHLYNPVTHKLQFADGRGFRTNEIEKTNISFGEHYLGKVAQEKKTLCLPDITADQFPCNKLVPLENFVSYIATPIYAKGQIKGVIEVFNRTQFNPDEKWINYFEILAGQTAIAIDNSQLFEGLQRSNFDLSMAYDATIEGWSRAMDLRDRETEGHTIRVTELTVQLAGMAGFSDEDIIHIRRGALLHDMGKLGIPDSILHKPGPLTDDEWTLMKKHPVFAHEMLSPIGYLKPAMDIPYCHHEKWDGSGYPRGLTGEEIPMAARIFSVVDVYDALTSDRPYRSAWTQEKALNYISSCSGTHFDPKVVNLFFKLVDSEPEWLSSDQPGQ
ncbi:MAG: hypothetical protein CVU40_16040 [Chloroflexi bacterium HGW-Chloroflexi-2]|nr:MAG: hypothetical protein CVU40_16040 [Chloroflexi bacterium HGW-Chloroflexi-2]